MTSRSPRRPTVTVIIPAYRAATTIGPVLDSLVPQAEAVGADVIVVESTGDATADEIGRRWPSVGVLAKESRTLPGAARNEAARLSTSELLVFLDADSTPDERWLETMIDALAPGQVAVAGAIENGTPDSAVGTAGWLLEFSDWLPNRPRKIRHAASASLLVRRDAFEEAGGFREDLFPGEDTLLTHPWAAAGRLGFAPGAAVRHQNRTTTTEFLRHQRRLGEAFVVVCESTTFPHRRFARRPLASTAGLLRLGAVLLRVRHTPRRLVAPPQVPLLILAGLAWWTSGVWRAAGSH